MSFKRIGPSFTECLPYLSQIRNTVDHQKPGTLWAALDDYIGFCARTGMMISNKSLYYSVKCSKETIAKWYGRTRKQHDPQYHDFAEMCKAICAAAREQYGIEGQMNPILCIFWQKSYDGFRDDPPDEYIENPLGDLPDANKMIQKYGGLTDDKT